MKEGKTAVERYRDYLDTLPLSTLRILGRYKGVNQPSSSKKNILVEMICNVLTGKTLPVPSSNRGAPPKQNYLAPEILQKLELIRRDLELQRRAEETDFVVASGTADDMPPTYDMPVYSGILEINASGYGFVRTHNCQPTVGGDVFIPAPVIHNLRLREGDFIACTAKPRGANEALAFQELLSVNGLPVNGYVCRPHFDALTAQYPKQKIALSQNSNSLALRVIDLFVPLGKGQRALVIAPPKAGKTTLLKEIANAVVNSNQSLDLIVLLIDERPEEVTDFRMEVECAEIISSTFDEGADHHIRAAKLAIEHAKRLAERGKDVVLLLDSLTKLTRAYNYVMESTGKTLTGGLDAGALQEPKRFFGTARNTVEGGSITMIATALVDTGSRMDDIIYEEFKGTGNADIFLSRELAERRVFPSIDVRRSGTRREEVLLSATELESVYRLRERGICDNMQGLLDMMRRTQNNQEFIEKLPEWLRVYRA